MVFFLTPSLFSRPTRRSLRTVSSLPLTFRDVEALSFSRGTMWSRPLTYPSWVYQRSRRCGRSFALNGLIWEAKRPAKRKKTAIRCDDCNDDGASTLPRLLSSVIFFPKAEKEVTSRRRMTTPFVRARSNTRRGCTHTRSEHISRYRSNLSCLLGYLHLTHNSRALHEERRCRHRSHLLRDVVGVFFPSFQNGELYLASEARN